MGCIGVKAKHENFASRRGKAELTAASQFFSLFVKLFLFPYPPPRSKFLDGYTKQQEVAQFPAAPSFCVLQNQTLQEEDKINQTYTYIFMIYDRTPWPYYPLLETSSLKFIRLLRVVFSSQLRD